MTHWYFLLILVNNKSHDHRYIIYLIAAGQNSPECNRMGITVYYAFSY